MRKQTPYFVAVSTELWQDERVLWELSDAGKLVWLYLLTGPHVRSFPLAFATTHDSLRSIANITPRTFAKGMAEVSKLGMVKTDWRRHVILLPNGLRHRPDVRGQSLSSKTLKGWITYCAALPECALKQEAWSLLREAAEEGRPAIQGENEVVWFNQALEIIKQCQEAPSKPVRRGTGAASKPHRSSREYRDGGGDSEAAARSKPVVVVGKKNRHLNPVPATTTTSGRSGKFEGWCEYWNSRRGPRMGPEALHSDDEAELEKLLAAARKQRPEDWEFVVRHLMAEFLEDPSVYSPKLRTLLKQGGRVWGARLDRVCRDLPLQLAKAQVAAQPLPDTPAGRIWGGVLELLEQDGKQYALTWLSRMKPVAVTGDELELECPDKPFVEWVTDRYEPLLESVLAEIPDAPPRLHFVVLEPRPNTQHAGEA